MAWTWGLFADLSSLMGIPACLVPPAVRQQSMIIHLSIYDPHLQCSRLGAQRHIPRAPIMLDAPVIESSYPPRTATLVVTRCSAMRGRDGPEQAGTDINTREGSNPIPLSTYGQQSDLVGRSPTAAQLDLEWFDFDVQPSFPGTV